MDVREPGSAPATAAPAPSQTIWSIAWLVVATAAAMLRHPLRIAMGAAAVMALAVALRALLRQRSGLVSLLVGVGLIGVSAALVSNQGALAVLQGRRTVAGVACALVACVFLAATAADTILRQSIPRSRAKLAALIAIPITAVVVFVVAYSAFSTFRLFGTPFGGGGAARRALGLVWFFTRRFYWLPISLAAAGAIAIAIARPPAPAAQPPPAQA